MPPSSNAPCKPLALVVSAALMLAACASTRPNKEAPPMTPDPTPAGSAGQQNAEMPKEAPSVERLLVGIESMIRTSASLEDFTPERLRATLGIDIEQAKDGSGRYGAGGDIAIAWTYGIEVVPAGIPAMSPRFSFDITPAVAGETPDMATVCHPDFEQFAARLQAMGLQRTPYHAEHGRYLHDEYRKDRLAIYVIPGAQLDPDTMTIVRTCVRSIRIEQGRSE